MRPGPIEFTVMPYWPSSCAQPRTIIFTAAFVAE